jgi:hypothetical protein
MKLQCGYLPGTDSMCYHPIQNLKFWGKSWNICNFVLNGETIYTLENNNLVYNINFGHFNSYNIGIQINNENIYEQHQLYYIDLEFDFEPEYEIIKSMIVDH